MHAKHLPALFLLASTLAACGGGGGGAPDDTSAMLPDGTPNLATNSTAALFEAGGVFYFGGSTIFYNGVPQTYINRVRNGSSSSYSGITTLDTSTYAGATGMTGNKLFDELPHVLFDTTDGSGYVYLSERLKYRADGTSLIGDSPWRLDLTLASLAGTSIDAYRQQVRGGSATPAVTGTFSAGAQSVRQRFVADSELLAWPGYYASYLYSSGSMAHVNGLEDLPTLLCFRNMDAGRSLKLRVYANGTINFYLYPGNNACDGTEPAPAGTTTFVQKTLGSATYLELPFPAGISQADYDTRFTAAEFASGITYAIVQPADGSEWAPAFHFAAGAWHEDPVLHMNQQAAADFKAALNLP